MKALTILALLSLASLHTPKEFSLNGAWQLQDGNNLKSVIFSDKYFAVAEYNVAEKKFVATYGGSWSLTGGALILKEEFNTVSSEWIGKERRAPVSLDKAKIKVSFTGDEPQGWNRLDDGTPGSLSGAWLITARQVNGEMSKMTPGARRTMKILSGTKFQWIAYNVETKEFFGTGGGSYQTKDGKYVENIEFFSRDNSRVGSKLEFDFDLKDGNWHHQGLSSKGDPIDEVWTKRELIGL